ncbi:MAG TPA: hypothetical protein VEY69_10910 [Lautropia sp.]|jgi:hypothetical protein|nr:hypothetical protein [Lautropia sp.]
MPATSRDWIAVLWPAFLAACLLEIAVFALFDPHDLRTSGGAEPGIQSIYSVAFFGFWMIASLASLGTWTLTRRQ